MRRFLSTTTLTACAKGSIKQTEVILVGMGEPNRGMGWYHSLHLLSNLIPSAKLTTVVEPYFLGSTASGPPLANFNKYKDSIKPRGIQFVKEVFDVEPVDPDKFNRIAVISGRTNYNPRFLHQCIRIGCNAVYLEKPGAPSVIQLQAMRDEALANDVSVYMGFNKNVTKYVAKVLAFEKTLPLNSYKVLFASNNDYADTPESLGECFERNSEGLLKNMAIHELALLVTYYNVSVDNIKSATADKTFSSMVTLKGPSGKEFTDFERIKFTIVTKAGQEVSVQADRCGGKNSFGAVIDKVTNETLFRWDSPDDEEIVDVKKLEENYPLAMSYFLAADKDYITLLEAVANYSVTSVDPRNLGIANIKTAIETMKVAEFLTVTLQHQMRQSEGKYVWLVGERKREEVKE